LGCAKNRVDSEKTLKLLVDNGSTVVDRPEEAELLLINSCGFIGDAREETVDTILELAEYKKKNNTIKLGVMGCMVERFKETMGNEMPEIDYLFGLSSLSLKKIYDPSNSRRMLESGAVSAYLKIAEGCGNSCTFCSIPTIRGPLKSRPINDVVGEAKELLQNGIKEINIVSQDTTRYGADLKIKDGLNQLLKKMVELEPARVRILYAYPTLLTDQLINTIAGNKSICNYIDVPFQHVDSSLLKRMGRQESESDILRLIEKIRKVMPDGAIRTSFITGFPGETEKEFQTLLKFVEREKLDHVGVFTYSPEEGTKAFELGDSIPEKVKTERKNRLMEIQQEISFQKNSDKVGRILPVMVERYDEEDGLLTGRLETQAPDVDGEVILDDCQAEAGEIIDIEILEAMEYDLVGREV